ncbi:hypothetical protein GTP41_25970 [Pseudoduganella sp. DS3]|uniref:Uncharacterized protein n=1 Tax=Pseudoduganella guangdongensis TaxID=2692179 RepID=A0A6N9HRK1_9BURK|nr:hypothetical protein [Pseudoduganella guangdongensis]MYN05545.1 hypothetical protein [Pseudoduganella guangdongensis]
MLSWAALTTDQGSQLASAAAVSSAELQFREQIGLVDYQSVEYRDTKGAAISFAQFEKKLAGSGFSMQKRKVRPSRNSSWPQRMAA